jgi:hypothetical protein
MYKQCNNKILARRFVSSFFDLNACTGAVPRLCETVGHSEDWKTGWMDGCVERIPQCARVVLRVRRVRASGARVRHSESSRVSDSRVFRSSGVGVRRLGDARTERTHRARARTATHLQIWLSVVKKESGTTRVNAPHTTTRTTRTSRARGRCRR